MRLFSPAKVNLLLAVTGKRTDGYHDLLSLVSPITFGDFVTVTVDDATGDPVLSCTNPEVPSGDENLVIQAAKAFLAATGLAKGLTIHLEKHIPTEAGLGGGSSNAATTLMILNRVFSEPLSIEDLTDLATELGSDCPLFLHREPVLMRGRGEQIERLDPTIVAGLLGRRLAVFKPSIGVSTPWAYGRLASQEKSYADREKTETRVLAWKQGELALEELMFNSLEDPVFEKFVALPALFESIQENLGLQCLMSGSGSSCFALMGESDRGEGLKTMVREAWGDEAIYFECQLGMTDA
ncbi:MAG: 4-(cytidine 5'-diphospho)-2-C-methyl-D-erythritol kinase [Verrucomicrobia bacterium]|nr:4-(cytidine 5'-diphospho)-2-C-methyl-D-erythritol kinase [Verrucomicrobiota bacterium]